MDVNKYKEKVKVFYENQSAKDEYGQMAQFVKTSEIDKIKLAFKEYFLNDDDFEIIDDGNEVIINYQHSDTIKLEIEDVKGGFDLLLILTNQMGNDYTIKGKFEEGLNNMILKSRYSYKVNGNQDYLENIYQVFKVIEL
ncbi:hypothetical protein [Winogradskyella sediminis]|uniref:hypothetical protein n=1 Tax=Winogradskyella sediminis TaxID=1382466 RepID=UPI003AA8DB58